MDGAQLYDAIRTRYSERRYEHEQLTAETAQKICEAFRTVRPIADSTRTELRLYSGGEIRAYSPFCVAAFTEDSRIGVLNAGYTLEQMDLWFNANGFGSCWTEPKNEPADTPRGLRYAGCVCFGVPRGERRSTLSQFRRKKLASLTDIPDPGPILETARLAPSALNRQPWYFSGSNEDFVVSTRKVLTKPWLTAIDAGIVLLYIQLAAEHEGKHAHIDLSGGGAAPPKMTFQASVRISAD